MAQKIVTVCDAHQLHEEEVPGEPWEVTVKAPGESRATTWTVDLCANDAKGLVDLRVMLDAVGRVTEGPRRRPYTGRNAPVETAQTAEGWPCPVEGCGKVSATRSSLSSHVRDRHNTTLAEATGAPTPYACDVPGCGRWFSHAQGLAAHQRAHARAEGSGAAG